MTTNSDTISIFERLLLVQFGSTGEVQAVSTLKLEGLTFTKAGTEIRAGYNDGNPPFLLEKFPSEPLAASAFKRLQTVLTRYAKVRRTLMVGKGIIKWVATPLLLGMLVLAINMLATRALQPEPANSGATAAMLPLPASLDAIQQGMGIPAQAPPSLSSAELAKAMSAGVRTGKYSVQVSQGPKGTIYVFSDPSCPHCQQLEGELEKLARDYTIHIFPVTVIGGDASANQVAKILCQKPAARAALWKRVVSGGDLQTAQCEDGSVATGKNNDIFRTMGFPGTPTIINSAGETTPDSVANTATDIARWMSARAQR